MKTRTVVYLTLIAILVIANMILRNPIYPSDITGDPDRIPQLTSNPGVLMYGAPLSEEQYRNQRRLSPTERTAQWRQSRWWNDVQVDTLNAIENRGLDTYKGLFDKLPDQVQSVVPAPPQEWPWMPSHSPVDTIQPESRLP